MNQKTEQITIGISEESVYAGYAVEDRETIDEMLVDAIEKVADTKPISKKLEITFLHDSNLKFDEERFTTAYKNTMQNKVDAKKREITRCLFTGISLLVVAISALLAFVYFFVDKSLFWNKFGEIISWVFVWGSVEVFTIELIQLLIDKAKAKRLLNATIIIKSKSKKA